MDAQHKYHARCDAAMDKLADKWDAVGADIAVILGNDQDEVYETEQLNPAFMVFFGEKIPNYPQTEEQRKKLPPGIAEAEHGHATETYTEYPGVPDLGAHIIKTLCDREFDVAASKVWPKHARNGASHAFGHIYRQVMRDNVVPNVPIYQNTFFPPNQPKASRSYRFGQIVKEAIDSWPSDKKVAVFASGGMSHFVIDEAFDRKFVDALGRKDKGYLTSISLKELQSGTSELKSWISLAGLMENVDAKMHEIDYVPCYRSGGRHRHCQRLLLVGVQEIMAGAQNPYVARLRKVDCCAVSDALDSLKLVWRRHRACRSSPGRAGSRDRSSRSSSVNGPLPVERRAIFAPRPSRAAGPTI